MWRPVLKRNASIKLNSGSKVVPLTVTGVREEMTTSYLFR